MIGFRAPVTRVISGGGLPSVQNRVNRKTLEADNASFPRLPILKQRVELSVDQHDLGVYSVRDHRPPPSLATTVEVSCLENL